MTLDAGFSSDGGRGTGVVVALHLAPAVRLNLLQGRVHHHSHNAAQSTISARTHTHPHTPTESILLIRVRVGSTDSCARPVCRTHSSTFFSVNAPHCKPSPLAKKTPTCPCWSEEAFGCRKQGSDAGKLYCMDLRDLHKTSVLPIIRQLRIFR